jgi:hypothetical protein
MPAKAIAWGARRQIVGDTTQTGFVSLDHMIDFPAAVGSLAPVTALSQTNRIPTEVAVSVSLFPDLPILRVSHVAAHRTVPDSELDVKQNHFKRLTKLSGCRLQASLALFHLGSQP